MDLDARMLGKALKRWPEVEPRILKLRPRNWVLTKNAISTPAQNTPSGKKIDRSRMPKKSLRELERSSKKWSYKKQLKSIDELRRSNPVGGSSIVGKEEADPDPLANVPERLRKYSTHSYQSKMSNLSYKKRKRVENWLQNKEELDLSFTDISKKCEDELDLEISKSSLYRHLEWLEKKQNEKLVLTS